MPLASMMGFDVVGSNVIATLHVVTFIVLLQNYYVSKKQKPLPLTGPSPQPRLAIPGPGGEDAFGALRVE